MARLLSSSSSGATIILVRRDLILSERNTLELLCTVDVLLILVERSTSLVLGLVCVAIGALLALPLDPSGEGEDGIAGGFIGLKVLEDEKISLLVLV
jgi:hypothetical protein